jgi:hypothetical protein
MDSRDAETILNQVQHKVQYDILQRFIAFPHLY